MCSTSVMYLRRKTRCFTVSGRISCKQHIGIHASFHRTSLPDTGSISSIATQAISSVFGLALLLQTNHFSEHQTNIHNCQLDLFSLDSFSLSMICCLGEWNDFHSNFYFLFLCCFKSAICSSYVLIQIRAFLFLKI